MYTLKGIEKDELLHIWNIFTEGFELKCLDHWFKIIFCSLNKHSVKDLVYSLDVEETLSSVILACTS